MENLTHIYWKKRRKKKDLKKKEKKNRKKGVVKLEIYPV